MVSKPECLHGTWNKALGKLLLDLELDRLPSLSETRHAFWFTWNQAGLLVYLELDMLLVLPGTRQASRFTWKQAGFLVYLEPGSLLGLPGIRQAP